MRESIGVLLFGDLGDTLLTTPALRAIRERYPDSHIVAVGKANPLSLVHDMGLVDGTIEIDKHILDRPVSLLRPRAWLEAGRLVSRLRRERLDSLLMPHHLVTRWGAAKFAVLALASGAAERVGLDNGRGWFLTHAARDLGFGARHEAQYWLDVAAILDAQGEMVLVPPRITGEDRRTAGKLLSPLRPGSGPLIAIHPGTGWFGPGRRWPEDRFAETASILRGRLNARFVIVGGDEDAAAGHRVECRLGEGTVNLVRRTSLQELGAVLARCSLTISNDSGVAHLSAAVGTPVTAVFGPSNDRAWRPLLGAVVAADIGCRPCFYRDFQTGLRYGCASRECLQLVTPKGVADVAETLLQSYALAV